MNKYSKYRKIKKKNAKFQPMSSICYFLRCFIRNKVYLCFNWLLLSIFERYRKNFIISRDITNSAFIFSQADFENFREFTRYKNSLFKHNLVFFLIKNPYSVNLWIQNVFQNNGTAERKKNIYSSLHFVPYSLSFWRLNNIINGFGFSLVIKNKNYCLLQKEILFYFKILGLCNNIKFLNFFIFTKKYFISRYLFFSTWFCYLKFKENLIIEKNIETDILSNVLNMFFFFQKMNYHTVLLRLKQKNSIEILLSKTFRVNSDLDVIIDEFFFQNINNKNISFSKNSDKINLIYQKVYDKSLSYLISSIKHIRFLEFFLILETYMDYYPYESIAKYILKKFSSFPKNFFVHHLKYLKIKFNAFYNLEQHKYLLNLKNHKNNFRFLDELKFIVNNLNLQGLYEKKKETTLKFLEIKKLKSKSLKYKKSLHFITENIYLKNFFNRCLNITRFLHSLKNLSFKIIFFNDREKLSIPFFSNNFEFEFQIIFSFYKFYVWKRIKNFKKTHEQFLTFNWIIFFETNIYLNLLLRTF